MGSKVMAICDRDAVRKSNELILGPFLLQETFHCLWKILASAAGDPSGGKHVYTFLELSGERAKKLSKVQDSFCPLVTGTVFR